MPEVPVHAIRHMEFTGDPATKEIALAITDANGETRAYAINPATLRAFLAPLISLAATWSDDPDFSFEGLGGDRNALVAKQVLFARGRSDAECAIRLFLGKDVDFTFLLPLPNLATAFRAFVQHNPMFQSMAPGKPN